MLLGASEKDKRSSRPRLHYGLAFSPVWEQKTSAQETSKMRCERADSPALALMVQAEMLLIKNN